MKEGALPFPTSYFTRENKNLQLISQGWDSAVVDRSIYKLLRGITVPRLDIEGR